MKRTNRKKIIILFSGGYDSTLLVLFAMHLDYDVTCILYDYGQKHKGELKVARKFLNEHKLTYISLKIPITTPSKLTKGERRYAGVSEWHVPARNLTFMSFAVGIAESLGINLIWYGANYQDRINLFPDCYQEWVFEMNKVLAINGSLPITLEAPLLGMTKETIESFGTKIFKLNKNETFSGYGTIKEDN